MNCVEMKRRGAARLQKKLAGMTRDQQLAYWADRTEELRKRCAERRQELGRS